MAAPLSAGSAAVSTWKALIQQSKSTDGDFRLHAALQLRAAIRTAATAEDGVVPLDVPLQPLLINALLHLLHARAVAPSDSSAPSEELDDDASRVSVSALATLLSHPALLSNRVLIIVRKLDAFRQQQRKKSAASSQPQPLLQEIESLLAVHPTLVAEAEAENAAQAPDDSAERKAARIEKVQRKQAEAAEQAAQQRKIKALAQQQQQQQHAAGAHSDAAAASAALPSPSAAVASALPESDVTDGTESAPFGNFHTYYSFNPIAERLQFIPSQLAVELLHRKRQRNSDAQVTSHSFAFLDVGCNEGDLTVGLMQHLLAGLRGESDQPTVASVDAAAAAKNAEHTPASSSSDAAAASASAVVVAGPSSTAASAPYSRTQVHAVGVDIDPELIGRAQSKVAANLERVRSGWEAAAAVAAAASSPVPTLAFDTVDVMSEGAIERIRALVDTSVAAAAAAAASATAVVSPARPFDLVCVYSITMWIHLHHGDAGLRRFLSSLAALTCGSLILEAQPWHCYRNARERWRRCGKADPPAMATLQWRVDVEQRMIEYMISLGMRLRADLGSTKWQRRVLWFEWP